VSIIREILDEPRRTIRASPFLFEPTIEAAESNLKVLQSHNMSLKTVLENHPFSPSSFGSEFRLTSTLQKIFTCHPLWLQLKAILQDGAAYPMVELDDKLRQLDLAEGIRRGNHSGAKIFQEELEKKFKKEIDKGWMLPLPPGAEKLLPFAEYCPTSMIEQMTIDDMGTFIEKKRPIHDQSFLQRASETSVNGRVHKQLLTDCMYGHMLSRVIHYILWLRLKFPDKRILISKADLDSAYRRAHVDEKAAAKSLTWFIHRDVRILILCLRLIFGGTPGPSLFSIISECLTDLVNAILKCSAWDPLTLSSPLEEMMPPTQILSPDIPFAQTKPLSVVIPEKAIAKSDIFLDDNINVGIDTPANRPRLNGAVSLAVDVMSRPVMPNEPLPRSALLNATKLAAEGALEETKIVLGWKLDTRRLLISLPDHKFKAWTSQIRTIIETKKTTAKELETVLGRLTNAASILPMARHFLPRLRFLQMKMGRYKSYTLNMTLIADLEICLRILKRTQLGISMNSISFRLPSICYYEDACPKSLGGWNHGGEFYDFVVPEELLNRAHINELEFIASIIHPWIDLLRGRLKPGDCFLVMGDSTTAMGWMHKSKYREDGETAERHAVRLKIARKLAELVIDNDLTLYSQWFPGKDNVIADCLSRDTHLSDTDRIALLSSFFQPQDMPCFRRVTVPKEISEWVCSILQLLPKRTQTLERHTTSGLQIGISGRSSLSDSARQAIDTWQLFPEWESRQSSEPLQLSSDKHYTRAADLREWLQAQSSVPLQMYHRDSSQLDALIPG
jgi:hypothetical protein